VAQRIVARVMPRQVIHHGEMVQVHEQHHALACSRSMRRRTVIAQTGGALGQQGSQTLVKRRTVEQLGQRIVLGLPSLLLLRLPGRGDVFQNPHRAAIDGPSPHAPPLYARPHRTAVLAHEAHVAIKRAVHRKLGLHPGASAGIFFRGGVDGARGLALQFGRGIAQHQAGLPPHHLQHAVARDDDTDRGVVQNRLKLAAQRGLLLRMLAALARQPLQRLDQVTHFTPHPGPLHGPLGVALQQLLCSQPQPSQGLGHPPQQQHQQHGACAQCTGHGPPCIALRTRQWRQQSARVTDPGNHPLGQRHARHADDVVGHHLRDAPAHQRLGLLQPLRIHR